MEQTTNSLLGTEEQPSYTPSSDEKTMAVLSHVLGIFFSFIPPLIIYLIKKDESKYVADHSREALNFQITLIIGYIIGFITLPIFLLGVLVWIVVGLGRIILGIVATMKANDGKMYRYPLTIRLVT